MSEQKLPSDQADDDSNPMLIQCRRVHRPMPVDDHKDCPYCFGDEATIRTCGYASFCDFDPDLDPVNFGFPEELGHYQRTDPRP